MEIQKTYYEILEIQPNSTELEIKQAYKQLSLKWHPDKNLDNLEIAYQKIQKINEAYETLKDPMEKQKYDYELQMGGGAGGAGGWGGGGGGGDGDISPEDFFQELTKLGLFFNHLHEGFQGKIPPSHAHMQAHPHIFFFHHNHHQKPRKQLINHKCTLEDIYQNKEIWVPKPPNPNTNTSDGLVVHPKDGKWINGVIEIHLTDVEDVEVVIHLTPLPHTNYIVQGMDIHTTLGLTWKESVCGFSKPLTFLDNRIYRFQGKGGKIILSQTNTIYPQLGLGWDKDKDRGNLVVTYQVSPTTLTEEQVKQIRDILV